MTDTLDKWHRLMASVGIHGPLIQTCKQYKQQSNPLFELPLEIRLSIYLHLLVDGPNPTILRTPSGQLCIHIRRPRAFSHLLLTCKQSYIEATPLPFLERAFRLFHCNESFDADPSKCIPHDDSIGNSFLLMPRHLAVSLDLEPTSLMVQLTRLRLVLEGRRDAAFETRVVLSLGKLANARKKAVLRSLKAILKGSNAVLKVKGAADVEGDNAELELVETVFRFKALQIGDAASEKQLDSKAHTSQPGIGCIGE